MNGLLAAITLQEFLANLVQSLSQFVHVSLKPETLLLVAFLLAAFVHAALLLGLFAGLPVFYIWLERKVAGRIQDRLGPTRVGGSFGWLQTIADGIKLIQKEDLVPEDADSLIFRMSPYLATIASFAAFMVLPLADGWIAVSAECGAFLILALMSLEVLGIILAGYSSGSKWALFGAMREAAQMVSYEIPLAICALIPLMIAGSLNFQVIGRLQSGWFWNWFIFHDPFTFVAFFCYFTVATASVKRAPFDLAEAESELVAGFHTEYSGFRWSIFFLAEYSSMFAVSAVAALLFLGGWNTGIGLIDDLVNSLRGTADGFLGIEGFSLGTYLANLFGAIVLVKKGCLLVFVQIWVRWTLPRLRIDQVMTTCLKYLVPISCFLFLMAVLWPLVLASTMSRPVAFGPALGEKSVSHATTSAVPVASDAQGVIR
ncbi:complex I subunit 1/NuoH family protein [Schlesneria paludicola]|uniref:complex I subunit 1/NuoH family protein n=1 Tax=Schlesneria paludicola TaxID=360056 RepID=UPI00029AF2F1|nr:complex I subunit 1 family protein [Schlesneria paludicola]